MKRMRVMVNKIPESSGECLFSDYIEWTSKHACKFERGLYSRCQLECGEKCPYLVAPLTPIDEED